MNLYLPSGCCEPVMVNGEPKPSCIKVNRGIFDDLPKCNTIIRVYMGNGFSYNGLIYQKNKAYVYIRLS